jgi:hypothetical protein
MMKKKIWVNIAAAGMQPTDETPSLFALSTH